MAGEGRRGNDRDLRQRPGDREQDQPSHLVAEPERAVERVGRLREQDAGSPGRPRACNEDHDEERGGHAAHTASLRRRDPARADDRALLLRQWRDDDADALYEIYTQPKYLETMPALTLDATHAQVEGFSGAGRTTGTASGPPATSRAVCSSAGSACSATTTGRSQTARSPRWLGPASRLVGPRPCDRGRPVGRRRLA
jgi:hypothetical protein